MRMSLSSRSQYILALGFATAVCVGLFAAITIYNHSFGYDYLLQNLLLAWIPFVLALLLKRTLKHKLWSSWEGLALSIAWLAFLPNSFYMISDFIHLPEVAPDQLLFSTILFVAFIYTGVLLGYSGLYLIHQEFKKRFSDFSSTVGVGLLLLVCSGAIYIGRDLRWNTWDVLTNPQGLIFDLSDRLVHPSEYPQMLGIVVPFFVLLGSMYIVAWKGIGLLQSRSADLSE